MSTPPPLLHPSVNQSAERSQAIDLPVSLAPFFSFPSRYHWVFSVIGPSQIVSIILRATGGLEKRQAEKYGSSKEWKEYAKSTPVFMPGTRQYTWGKVASKKD